MTIPTDIYTNGSYFKQNPTWDREDSPWKAALAIKILQSSGINPQSICEVGCGAGGVLAELQKTYFNIELFGYDIAPDAAKFWGEYKETNIHCQVGDFFVLNKRKYDVILLLDVIEHLIDPFAFLKNLHGTARYYIFHIPLDLSAFSVLREKPILNVREKVGHIHYFTKNLALSLIKECEFNILKWNYSGATFNIPRRRLKTVLASIPRRLAYVLNKDIGVRALGGETLIVLAEDKE